jgi:hypothetical protein
VGQTAVIDRNDAKDVINRRDRVTRLSNGETATVLLCRRESVLVESPDKCLMSWPYDDIRVA